MILRSQFKSLDAQEERINALDETTTKLILANHYDVQMITKRRAIVAEWYVIILSVATV